MPSSLLDIEQQASQLPPADRAKLAEFLLESLQEPVIAEVEREWENEITIRVAAYDKGETSTFPAAEVFAEARRMS
jgi:putative addiction module component (TIGR02574 family)